MCHSKNQQRMSRLHYKLKQLQSQRGARLEGLASHISKTAGNKSHASDGKPPSFRKSHRWFSESVANLESGFLLTDIELLISSRLGLRGVD